MSERISYRVVRTAALAKSSEVLRRARRSKNQHYQSRDVVSVDVRIKRPSNSVGNVALFCDGLQNGDATKAHHLTLGSLTYTPRLEVARVFSEDGLTGRILDFYA
jgi:hypothetical protein